MQRNAKILATCLKDKESSQFISPFTNFVLFSMHCMIVECEY